MTIYLLSVNFFGNAWGLCHSLTHPSGFLLVGPNLEFRYIRSSKLFVLVSVKPFADFPVVADLFAGVADFDSMPDLLLDPQLLKFKVNGFS